MVQTLSGWLGSALDELRLVGGEPLTWLILTAAAGLALWRSTQRPRWRVPSAAAYVGTVAWLLATLAITIYPIHVSFEPPPWERFETESIVPFAGTIQSLDHMRDRTWSPEEHAAMTAELAADFGIPPEDVNLPWQITGTDPGVVLRDPLGNLLLFVPLGLLAALGGRHLTWRRVELSAAAISVTIEASQLVFGLGSLASVDDVIFNTFGAVVGFAAYRILDGSFAALPACSAGRFSRNIPALAERRLRRSVAVCAVEAEDCALHDPVRIGHPAEG